MKRVLAKSILKVVNDSVALLLGLLVLPLYSGLSRVDQVHVG